MFLKKRNSKAILLIALVLILTMTVYGCGLIDEQAGLNGSEEGPGETEEEEDPEETGEDLEEKEEDLEEDIEDIGEDIEESLGDEEDTEDEEEKDPYSAAESVAPIQELNVEMHSDFEPILEELFEKEPKLIKTGDVVILAYVADRVITSEDVTEIKDFLVEEKGYEFEGVESEEGVYDLNFSAEILGQSYNGNIYVQIFAVEEGENAQKIIVRIL